MIVVFWHLPVKSAKGKWEKALEISLIEMSV